MRVLMTGSTGFVGSNLSRRLLHDGHEIHLLVRPGYTRWRIEAILSEVRLHEVDLGDEEVITRVVDKIRPDWVFNVAAHNPYHAQTNLREAVRTDIIGTINLVEACLKAGFAAFVNSGTSQEYGFKEQAPTETDWLDPVNNHAFTRASVTLFCRSASKRENVHLPTLRLYSVYGPYEQPTRLMPHLIMRGLKGELPPLVNPDIQRDFVYVDDVVEAYLLAATTPDQELGAVYNVGTGRGTPLREAVEVARQVLNIKAEPEWGAMPDRQWDTTTWVSDNRKIMKDLGWRPRYSFEQGFSSTADWFRENPSLQSHYLAGKTQ